MVMKEVTCCIQGEYRFRCCPKLLLNTAESLGATEVPSDLLEPDCNRVETVCPRTASCDTMQDTDGMRLLHSHRQSAVDLLEYLGDEAAEGRGQNVLDVEVLWAPAEDGDSLTNEYLYTKWPELRQI